MQLRITVVEPVLSPLLPATMRIISILRIPTIPTLANGVTIASPSAVLCMVNPNIRNVLQATSPNKTAAPIARHSSKLCNPIPVLLLLVVHNDLK